MLEQMFQVGEAVTDALAVQNDVEPTYVIPLLNDNRLGRTAFYLERVLGEQGKNATHVSSRELTREIEKSRTSADFSTVIESLARVCQLTRQLADWDEDASRLVLVTSEPFIMRARAVDTVVAAQANQGGYLEPGEVVGVHASSFKIA